jgi:hypothetical protein
MVICLHRSDTSVIDDSSMTRTAHTLVNKDLMVDTAHGGRLLILLWLVLLCLLLLWLWWRRWWWWCCVCVRF